MPLRGSMMQVAAAPAAAVAASAAARVACDTAATICISDAPCGREAWDCRSGSTMLGKKRHMARQMAGKYTATHMMICSEFEQDVHSSFIAAAHAEQCVHYLQLFCQDLCIISLCGQHFKPLLQCLVFSMLRGNSHGDELQNKAKTACSWASPVASLQHDLVFAAVF